MGSEDAHDGRLRASADTAESSLPPTPSTLASLRISTDTWSQLPDSPTGHSPQYTEKQLLAAELEARNQALRQALEHRGTKPVVARELSSVSEGVTSTPDAMTISARSSAVDALFAMMERNKLRTLDIFNALDRDGGGTLNVVELKEAFALHGMQLDHSLAESLLRLLDPNGDGEVDRQEFLEQMRMLKKARYENDAVRNAAQSSRQRPEPEPEPEPELQQHSHSRSQARRVPRQQRPNTAPKSTNRALSSRAAASAARLSGHGATTAGARSRLAARSSGGGLPPWLPGGTGVRSSASSIGSAAESMSLSAHASRAQSVASGRVSRSGSTRTGLQRQARGTGNSRVVRRQRPAWANPPPTPTVAVDSDTIEDDVAEANNSLGSRDLPHEGKRAQVGGHRQVCLMHVHSLRPVSF